MDLPVWQELYQELRDDNFTVLTVAMDSRGPDAARPWIEQAKPDYDCLVDQDHHVAELYNMVNVPQAVWIDEEGMIVRPTEAAGAVDSFRSMDRTTFAMSDEATAEREQGRAVYLDAIRDWVAKGDASEFAFSGDELRARQSAPTEAIALANACFRLGQYLQGHGNRAEGVGFLSQAIELRPDSWNFWRQTADLDEVGKSGGPEFWARVDALGEDHYYAPVDLPGMPT